MTAVQLLDILVIIASGVSAWLWLRATRSELRRIDYHERIDAADLNRFAVNFNRSQILNRRAALATAVALALNAARYLVGLAA